ncbi:MAG: glycine--tRNA ligase subunit beta, partial [Pseudomonadota bacterium]
MADLILELHVEEIPPALQQSGIDRLATRLSEKLGEYGLEGRITHRLVTPRRMGLVITGLPIRQRDRQVEIRGPKVGAPEQAIQGFLRANGLAEIGQCQKLIQPQGEWWLIKRNEPGRFVSELLPTIIEAVLNQFEWPKAMRQGASDFRWCRPLVAVLAVFEGKPVEARLSLGGKRPLTINLTDQCHPHSVLGNAFPVRCVDDYLHGLERGSVIGDFTQRRAKIAADLHQAASTHGLEWIENEKLLDRVTGLVEDPVVMLAALDDAFKDLPKQVITSCLGTHQGYFMVKDKDRQISHFAFVANQPEAKGSTAIRDGNLRVARARLADARFVLERDLKSDFDVWRDQLRTIQLYQGLGTLYDKSERLDTLCQKLARCFQVHPNHAAIMGRLAKCDLASELVREFPDLQGFAGSYYYCYFHGAEQSGLIKDALREQYQPAGPDDDVPKGDPGRLLAFADRLDQLAGFWTIGKQPSGSRDPLALRRAGLAAIRILLAQAVFEYDSTDDGFDLRPMIEEALALYGNTDKALAEDLQRFMMARLKNLAPEDALGQAIAGAVIKDERARNPFFAGRFIDSLHGFLQEEKG